MIASDSRPKLFFYVQHLLGIGHLVRALRLARALAREFAVDLVVGGMPLPDLDAGDARLVQLAPVRATPDFGELLDADGHVLSSAAKDARRDSLLAAFEAARPDVLLVEAFPFGRSQMRFELLPLLQRARALTRPPLTAVSIRDILQRGRAMQRLEETAAMVERYFDLVLVHGDDRMVRLGATFELADRFAGRTRYTGLVGPPIGDADACIEHATDRHDVIVSAGGGAVGERLMRAALAARLATTLRSARWLFLTGPNVPEAFAQKLAQELGAVAQAGVTIERFVPDLPRRLRAARLSISQAGYNTVADLLAARCRAVLAPYASHGETEQTDRARMMAARDLAVVLDDAMLDEPRLAEAVEAALRLPEPQPTLSLEGAQRTAAILMQALRTR